MISYLTPYVKPSNLTYMGVYGILHLINYKSMNPYVGQIVDFYPNNQTRLAAIITEVLPNSVAPCPSFRPCVNLIVFSPKGKIDAWEKVEPVIDNQDGQLEMKERWGFQHEFNIEQDETEHEYLGTQTNEHVGTLSNYIQ